MNDAEIREEFARRGVVVVDSQPPDRLHAEFKVEIGRWREMVEKAGLAGSE